MKSIHKTTNIKNKIQRFIFIFLSSLILIGCKKLVEINPPVTSTTGDNVYTSDATAASVLTAVYEKMSQTPGLNNISIRSGLSADEFSLLGNSPILLRYFRNSLTNASGETYWEQFYNYILTANLVIEGIGKSNSLTESVKRKLLGEAKFVRAFFHFYLTLMHGDIPLVTTSDYRVNNSLPRSDQNLVFQQIKDDLLEAQSRLEDKYLGSDIMTEIADRTRPNKWVATALLARVYLYMKDWTNAEMQSSMLLDNNSKFSLSTLDNVFKKNNNEAIWQLQPVNINGNQFWNTEDARVFVLSASPSGISSNKPVVLDSSLVNAFDINDGRLKSWVGEYVNNSKSYLFPYKYKVAVSQANITEYSTVLRLAEMYLIRAEARVEQNKFNEGLSDLNIIRKRAGLANLSLNDKDLLINAIMHERRLELFAEWGHRWFDLKRTGTVDFVMEQAALKKGGQWNSSLQLYPIPLFDLQQNANITQNPGY